MNQREQCGKEPYEPPLVLDIAPVAVCVQGESAEDDEEQTGW
jgi:hypothetical protein